MKNRDVLGVLDYFQPQNIKHGTLQDSTPRISFLMAEFFDLVEHPLELDEKETSTLEKCKDTYSIKVTESLASKRIFTSKEELGKVYVHALIDKKSFKIIGRSTSKYIFDVPADFHVPVSQATAELYGNIYKSIMSSDIEDLRHSAEDFNKRFYGGKKHFPFYPMSIITNIGLSDDKKFKEFLTKRSKMQHSIIVKHQESIPCRPKEAAIKAVERFVDSKFDPLAFLDRMFEEIPILKMEHIKRLYEQRVADNIKKKITFDRFRSFVPAAAYFMNSGPWYKTWIKFGLNPTKHQEMYRYQVLDSTFFKFGTQIFENPWIVEEIEKNADSFLNCDYNDKTGFLTSYGLLQIKKMLKIGQKCEEKQDNSMAFDVFD